MNEILAQAVKYQRTYHIVGRAHYLAADLYSALNHIFGIPVVVITTLVGTTIFGTLDKNPDHRWKIAAGLITLMGAVLSALQTSFGFAQTAEKHKAAGEAYRAIRRQFEIFQLKYSPERPEERAAAVTELEKIVSQLADLPKNFPTIPERCYVKAQKEEEKRDKQQ